MDDLDRPTCVAGDGGEVHGATDVAADEHVGTRPFEVLQLATCQPACHLGLRQVVRAGGAAADVRLVEVDQIKLRHTRQQRPRRRGDALGVLEVARVVIRGP